MQAATAASIASVMATNDFSHLDGVHRTTAFLGDAIGAVTLTGSAVAFGKLVGHVHLPL
jgi:NAD(P) transhydrogenase